MIQKVNPHYHSRDQKKECSHLSPDQLDTIQDMDPTHYFLNLLMMCHPARIVSEVIVDDRIYTVYSSAIGSVAKGVQEGYVEVS